MNGICLQSNLQEIFAGETPVFEGEGIPASSGVIM